MKSMIIVALALVAVAVAVPVEPVPAQILSSTFDKDPEGSYRFSFESDNGIKRQEEGQVKEVLDEEKKPHNVVVVRGEYSYPSQENPSVFEIIKYIADESGYRAEGPSVPKAASR